MCGSDKCSILPPFVERKACGLRAGRAAQRCSCTAVPGYATPVCHTVCTRAEVTLTICANGIDALSLQKSSYITHKTCYKDMIRYMLLYEFL